MSEQKQQLVDYSNYDGAYQEGEVLDADGQAIDLDELRQQQEPPKVPLSIKLLIVLVCSGLGAFGYMTLSKEAKKQPPPPPPRVDRSKTMIDALEHMNHSRTKTFHRAARCWELLARNEAKQAKGNDKLTDALLRKHCPALQGKTLSFEPRCEEGCQKVQLFRCEKGACEAVKDTKYIDFLYGWMQRVADSHHLVQAYVRLHQQIETQLKSKEKRWAEQIKAGAPKSPVPNDIATLQASFKKYETILERIVQGKFASATLWTTPYFGQSLDPILGQIATRLQAMQSGTADTSNKNSDDDEEQPKKRRKRRKKSRAASSKTKDRVIVGGSLVGYGRWPVDAAQLPSFRAIQQFRYEAIDETPFQLLSRADDLNFIDYTPAALNFWTHNLFQLSLHSCAQKVKGNTGVIANITMTIEVNSGRPFAESIQVNLDNQSDANACLKSLVSSRTVAYRGMPEDWKKATIQFKVHLFPQSPDSNP